MAKPLDILVTGATGTQGGAVARQLIKKGHRIRALTRNVASPAAQALAALGVELAQGNLEDRASVDRALTGMEAMFSVATPYEHGPEAPPDAGGRRGHCRRRGRGAGEPRALRRQAL